MLFPQNLDWAALADAAWKAGRPQVDATGIVPPNNAAQLEADIQRAMMDPSRGGNRLGAGGEPMYVRAGSNPGMPFLPNLGGTDAGQQIAAKMGLPGKPLPPVPFDQERYDELVTKFKEERGYTGDPGELIRKESETGQLYDTLMKDQVRGRTTEPDILPPPPTAKTGRGVDWTNVKQVPPAAPRDEFAGMSVADKEAKLVALKDEMMGATTSTGRAKARMAMRKIQQSLGQDVPQFPPDSVYESMGADVVEERERRLRELNRSLQTIKKSPFVGRADKQEKIAAHEKEIAAINKQLYPPDVPQQAAPQPVNLRPMPQRLEDDITAKVEQDVAANQAKLDPQMKGEFRASPFLGKEARSTVNRAASRAAYDRHLQNAADSITEQTTEAVSGSPIMQAIGWSGPVLASSLRQLGPDVRNEDTRKQVMATLNDAYKKRRETGIGSMPSILSARAAKQERRNPTDPLALGGGDDDLDRAFGAAINARDWRMAALLQDRINSRETQRREDRIAANDQERLGIEREGLDIERGKIGQQSKELRDRFRAELVAANPDASLDEINEMVENAFPSGLPAAQVDPSYTKALLDAMSAPNNLKKVMAIYKQRPSLARRIISEATAGR